MIKGIHAMFYSPEAEELRAFFRDKLSLDYFDVHDGWLIFPMAGEIGCHPDEESKHEISLYCDDIHGTVQSLKDKGVEFTEEITDWGWGVGTYLMAPGGMKIQLYEPRYQQPSA